MAVVLSEPVDDRLFVEIEHANGRKHALLAFDPCLLHAGNATSPLFHVAPESRQNVTRL